VVAHYKQLDKYSRLVTLDEIKAEDYNLNIRRYVDNAPAPEPQDVRAHLLGGIPTAEVHDKAEILSWFDCDYHTMFDDKEKGYYQFNPSITSKDLIASTIQAQSQILSVINHIQQASATWYASYWDEQLSMITDTSVLSSIRHSGIESFVSAFDGVVMFTEHQERGIFANRWATVYYHLKSIKAT